MTTATVTSQHTNYPHYFTTLYKGKRFDVNTKSGKAFFRGGNEMGSYSYEVKSSNILNILFKAVEKHLENKTK